MRSGVQIDAGEEGVAMAHSKVVLIEIPSEYANAIRRAVSRHGIAAVGYPDAAVAVAPVEQCSLCVLGVGRDLGAVARRIDALRNALGSCPVVVVGNELSVADVVRFMRWGASDVMALPPTPGELAGLLMRHVDLSSDASNRKGLIGSSHALERVRRRMKAVAQTDSTVLLSGETGCGKGVAAREIHRLSARRQRPFIHVDCAALATSVIDSELFGHERGAFTGAVGRRAGRFERAEGGTIFLDEVGDLEPPLQSKLLRVLQDREYERLGGSGTLAMTARVIAATNRDLRSEVAQGRFRADLLFRIKVFEIHIPPLRERRSDISQLVRALRVQLAARLQVRVPAFTEGFIRCLMSYDWPGNVRELMNLLERLMIERGEAVLDESAVDGLLDHSWLPGPFAAGTTAATVVGAPGNARGREGERERIAAALLAEGGNVTRASLRLGLARSTLRYRMRQLGL
jgi:DNA-binding NtrC family response regulator